MCLRRIDACFKKIHLAIPFLPYRTVKILESIGEIPHQLAKSKVKKVLVVTDEVIIVKKVLIPLAKC